MKRVMIPNVGLFNRCSTATPADCSQEVHYKTVKLLVNRCTNWQSSSLTSVAMFLVGLISGISATLSV